MSDLQLTKIFEMSSILPQTNLMREISINFNATMSSKKTLQKWWTTRKCNTKLIVVDKGSDLIWVKDPVLCLKQYVAMTKPIY